MNRRIKMLQIYIYLLDILEEAQEIKYMLQGKKTAFDSNNRNEKGQWITLKNGSKVFISEEGKITKGPKELKGKKLSYLNKGETSSQPDVQSIEGAEKGKEKSNEKLNKGAKNGTIINTKGLVNHKTVEVVKSTIVPAKPKVKDSNGREFNWSEEVKKGNEVYEIKTDDGEVQGRIAFKQEREFTHLSLIEAAPHNNKHNPNFKGEKKYENIGGRLTAFAVKKSIEAGNDGYMILDVITKLIPFYRKEFGAYYIGGPYNKRMIIDEIAARKLIEKYGVDD